MIDPIDDLFEVVEVVRLHGEPRLTRWLENALNAYLEGSSLEEAFCVKAAATERTVRTRFLFRTRNEHLRNAWKLVSQELISDWERATQLAAAIESFESRDWPALEKLDSSPDNTSSLTLSLFQAKRCGLVLPKGVRQLYRLFH